LGGEEEGEIGVRIIFKRRLEVVHFSAVGKKEGKEEEKRGELSF